MARAKPNGRISGPARFVQIPYWVLETDAARRLSGTAFKVLVYVVKRYNGFNNGKIAFGARSGCFVPAKGTGELADLPIGFAPRTISDALYELEAAGFIRRTQDSTFDQKRLTREWRLTWLAACEGASTEPPTKEFATAAGEFKRPKQKQKPERPRALCEQLQGAYAPSIPQETTEKAPYRAPTRPMEQSHRAPTRPHLVTIPSAAKRVACMGIAGGGARWVFLGLPEWPTAPFADERGCFGDLPPVDLSEALRIASATRTGEAA